ncbi:DUF2786 domain-containing protein [Acinetobacter nosocomialis]|uniref:DUF2786 domain-containing protein n=1 Tax=Acinetobacter calcoaceticus/baumannii complex TaxID=909768 RepID=UPI0024556D0B|nr:DUF2786 domain-containing protein [Acinetobacter nosocomialis]
MDEVILRKIKRCFELSKSSNEHEAALAIKQMQALMQKHGVNEKHIKAADVCEVSYELKVQKPAQWVLALHSAIAQALDCKSVISHCKYFNSDLVFIGVGSGPEIANYAFEVLFRKLKQNRAEYIENNLFRFKRANKTKLADAYCSGWVQNVYSKVKNLNPNLEIKEQIKAYQETKMDNFNPNGKFTGFQRFDSEDGRVLSAMSDGYMESKDINIFAATEHKESLKIGERA